MQKKRALRIFILIIILILPIAYLEWEITKQAGGSITEFGISFAKTTGGAALWVFVAMVSAVFAAMAAGFVMKKLYEFLHYEHKAELLGNYTKQSGVYMDVLLLMVFVWRYAALIMELIKELKG